MLEFDDKGVMILDKLTLSELRLMYHLKKLYPSQDAIDDLEESLDEERSELDEFIRGFKKTQDYHRKWIDKLKKMLDDPRCKDPSAINHNIEIHEATIERNIERFVKLSKKKTDEHHVNKAKWEWLKAMETFPIEYIQNFTINKFDSDPAAHAVAVESN